MLASLEHECLACGIVWSRVERLGNGVTIGRLLATGWQERRRQPRRAGDVWTEAQRRAYRDG